MFTISDSNKLKVTKFMKKTKALIVPIFNLEVEAEFDNTQYYFEGDYCQAFLIPVMFSINVILKVSKF